MTGVPRNRRLVLHSLTLALMLSPFISAGSLRSEAKGFSGEPVSMELIGVSLTDFLRVISHVSGLNILVDPDVEGTLTLNVEKVPWDELLDTVLTSYGLVRTQQGNLVRISRQETLAEFHREALHNRRERLSLEPLVTNVRTLRFAEGEILSKALKDQLSQRGRVTLDKRTNSIVITDVRSHLDEIMYLVDLLDIPARQVEIEARIVEATSKFVQQLGIQLGLHAGNIETRYRAGGSIKAPVETPIGKAYVSAGRILDTFLLDASITAAEAKGEAKMLSKPRIRTQDNSEARIVQGAKIPIPVQMNYTTNVRYETAALKLSVRPRITAGRMVALRIRVENSVPDFTRTVRDIPTILTSESETRLTVADGATTVIGGIIVETNRKGVVTIPGFSRLPLVGRLFRRTDKDRETREILFFITSRIKATLD